MRTVNCRRHHHGEQNLHPNNGMTHLARKFLFAAVAGFTLLAAPSPSNAQEKPDRPPWAQPGATGQANPAPVIPIEKAQEPPAPRGTIKVNVNLVNVLVSVLDEHNRPSPDLPLDAFQVFEEGVLQKIDFFESETKQPLDLALMVDASLSAHSFPMPDDAPVTRTALLFCIGYNK